ncbi:MAG: RecX family transcriptional regulator [Firmicutes bacterium]|nr:RecX family transcriptional regulator [Bacillota bacterium]
MPIITKLEAQKNNKDRLSVFVDNEFFCGITLDHAIKYNIVTGKELTEAELALLLSESGENDLYLKALGYILKSPRTEREITIYLYKKDASSETVGKIIERLKTMNYINDEAYAKMFTEQKSGKLGIGAIRSKLTFRGIHMEIIDRSLDEVENQTQDELAQAVAEKYMRNKDRDPKTLQKLYRHLASKGFDFELCSRVVEEQKKDVTEDMMNEYRDKWEELRQAKLEMKKRKKELKDLKKQILESGE